MEHDKINEASRPLPAVKVIGRQTQQWGESFVSALEECQPPRALCRVAGMNQMDIFLQNKAPLEAGHYRSVWYLINFMYLQIVCVDDADRRKATCKRREDWSTKVPHQDRLRPR